MKYMILTHCIHDKQIRRFFVEEQERLLYHILESEIDTIITNKIIDFSVRDLTRAALYNYLNLRVDSLNLSGLKDFVYMKRLRNHMLDYIDVIYERRVFKLGFGIPMRMISMSEPLSINNEETCQ